MNIIKESNIETNSLHSSSFKNFETIQTDDKKEQEEDHKLEKLIEEVNSMNLERKHTIKEASQNIFRTTFASNNYQGLQIEKNNIFDDSLSDICRRKERTSSYDNLSKNTLFENDDSELESSWVNKQDKMEVKSQFTEGLLKVREETESRESLSDEISMKTEDDINFFKEKKELFKRNF